MGAAPMCDAIGIPDARRVAESRWSQFAGSVRREYVKLVELAVRNVIHELPVRNTDALANPEALEHFRDLPELAR